MSADTGARGSQVLDAEGLAPPSLTLRRRLTSPPEKVFRAWTEPQALRRWFFPMPGTEVPLAEVDLRVGGRYRIIMRTPGGEEHRVGGVYREIVPDRRLAFTWAWESTPERESLVTIDLAPTAEGGTLLTLMHERFFDAAARDRHLGGWSGLFSHIDESIAALD